MSAESDFRTLLAATPAVTVLVGQRIRANRAEHGDTRPFVVFRRDGTATQFSLDGSVADEQVTLEVQCWADTQSQADAVADAVSAAVQAAHQTVAQRSTDYDGELDLEATVLTVVWWTD